MHHTQTNATRSYPQWPKEIDVVVEDDGRKVKLVHQSRLLQDIFKDAFGNVGFRVKGSREDAASPIGSIASLSCGGGGGGQEAPLHSS